MDSNIYIYKYIVRESRGLVIAGDTSNTSCLRFVDLSPWQSTMINLHLHVTFPQKHVLLEPSDLQFESRSTAVLPIPSASTWMPNWPRHRPRRQNSTSPRRQGPLMLPTWQMHSSVLAELADWSRSPGQVMPSHPKSCQVLKDVCHCVPQNDGYNWYNIIVVYIRPVDSVNIMHHSTLRHRSHTRRWVDLPPLKQQKWEHLRASEIKSI